MCDVARGIDHDGHLDWTFGGHSDLVTDVAVDADDHVYTSSDDGTIRKLSASDGSELWSRDIGARSLAVEVDTDGMVYAGGDDELLHRFDTAGEPQWTRELDAAIRVVTVDPDGNIYAGMSDNTVRKFDDEGSEVWRFEDHTNHIHEVAADPGAQATFPQAWQDAQ